MLAPHIELCGIFSMMQLWGRNNFYEEQCKSLRKFIDSEKEESDLRRNTGVDTFVMDKIKRTTNPLRSTPASHETNLRNISKEIPIQSDRKQNTNAILEPTITSSEHKFIPDIIICV